MAVRTDRGYRVFDQALAVATRAFTPLADRAARLVNLNITGASASDTWDIIVDGKPIMSLPVYIVGNQQFLGVAAPPVPGFHDFFTWYKRTFGQPMSIPVPQGLSCVVQSRGGATANIFAAYQECDPTDISIGELNHPLGTHYVLPIFGYVNASVAAVGDQLLDTQIAPSWVPSIWTMPSALGTIAPGFAIRMLALWLEGGGVNTYSGAANHQSRTDHLVVKRAGQQLFTRNDASSAGVPLYGSASAGGSANSVYGVQLAEYPAFQLTLNENLELVEGIWNLNPGERYQWYLNVTGDVTGGASYANFLQAMLIDITQTAAGTA